MVIFEISGRRGEARGQCFPNACFILLQSLLQDDCSRGLGDGSAIKCSSSRVQLRSPTTACKAGQWVLGSPALGRPRQETPWGLVASYSSQWVSFSFRDRPCLKK